MKTRFMGVVVALAAIVVLFAAVVFTIAAIQDYRENKGHSFIERVASIVGLETLVEEAVQVKVEATDEDVAESEKRSSDPPEAFRYLYRSEDAEEWLDDLFDREWLDREDSFRFEDRIERLPDLRRFDDVEGSPFARFDLEGAWGSDWIDELVERGWMTEEDADRFKSWFDDLPKELDERIPGLSGDRDFEFDSDDGRFRFRWRWNGSDDDWFFESHPEHDKDAKNGV